MKYAGKLLLRNQTIPLAKGLEMQSGALQYEGWWHFNNTLKKLLLLGITEYGAHSIRSNYFTPFTL